jgi:hypothetical protein
MAVVDGHERRLVALPDERGERLVGLVPEHATGVASGHVDRYYVNRHGASIPERNPTWGNPGESECGVVIDAWP